jgi:hypothetical protein
MERYLEVHKKAAAASARYAAAHAVTCPIHIWAVKHGAAVEAMVALAAEGRKASGTKQMHLGEGLYLLPSGDGDAALDAAILTAQNTCCRPNTDGFGRAEWYQCTCGNKHNMG